MSKFSVNGFYLYDRAPGGRGDLAGDIDVNDDGVFSGVITDFASSTPRQEIRGHFRSEDGLDKLLFLKFPPSMALANLAYELTKKSNGQYEGVYSGRWAALPMKVGFSEDYGIFVAQVDMTMLTLSDRAELIVRQK